MGFTLWGADTRKSDTLACYKYCSVVLWDCLIGFVWRLLIRILTALGAVGATQMQPNANVMGDATARWGSTTLVAAWLGVCSQPDFLQVAFCRELCIEELWRRFPGQGLQLPVPSGEHHVRGNHALVR